jgi:5-methylcytosine-specific restriction endonuclease McrA
MRPPRKKTPEQLARGNIVEKIRYIKKREEIRVKAVIHRATHPGEDTKRTRRWRTENPLAAAALRALERARKRNATGRYTAREFRALCDESSWQCSYCATVLDIVTVQADHIIPLSRGGSNGIENIAVSCASCNCRKHNTPLPLWLSRTGRTAFGPNLLSNIQSSQ